MNLHRRSLVAFSWCSKFWSSWRHQHWYLPKGDV